MSEVMAKPVSGLFPELYQDAGKLQGVPGTLLPAARTRSLQEQGTESAGVGVAAEGIGASFDLQKPVAHNIVEWDDAGNVITTLMNEKAIEILRKRNHVERGQVGNPITLKEAIRLANGGEEKQASVVPLIRANGTPASADFLELVTAPLQALVSLPRIPVKFECSFGKFSAFFSRVWRDATNNHLLILEQHDPDSLFFEAPQVETPIIVHCLETQYNCVPATFFTLPNGQIRFTVLAIVDA